MATKWLRFDNFSDERDMEKFLQEGKCVIVKITGRHLAKKYKYKMFLPIVSYDGYFYSTDIYQKAEFCKSCNNIGVYSTWYTVDKIVKAIDIKDVMWEVNKYYYDAEKNNPKTQEALLGFIPKIQFLS